MDSNKKQLLCTCYHCGNTGLLDIVGEHKHVYGGPIFNEQGKNIDYELEETFKWAILSCPVCHKTILYQWYNNETMCDHNRLDFYEEEILYPENKLNLQGVPSRIKSALESAIKVKNIDTALCVMALRRVLEQVCKENNAKGKTLEVMIRDLINKNILPNGFDEACAIIRFLGNKAAHGSESVFYLHEVEELISLLKAIIDYLYIIPQRINKVKEKITIKEEKTESESGE